MAVKFVPKRYSPGEIEALKKNPNVLEVRENRLLLTIEFRQQVYEAWIRRPERSTVRRMLEANGFDTQRLGLNFTKSVESVFKRGGRPKFSKASPETQANWAKTIYMPTMTAEELVESGKFVWDVNRLILHPDFEAELYRNYPQQSIEDGLLSVGISPADMGYHKIYWLQEKFEHSSGQDTNRSATRGRTAYYTAATVEQYRKHPYVQTATREKIELNKAFFEAAAPIAVLAFDDILRVFDIDPEIFSVTERYRMSRVLAAWATPADRETIDAAPTRKILRNRMRALDSIVEKGFLQIGDIVSSLNVLQKKSLCLWLRDLPPDPGRKYSVRKILSLMKISRASYYAILKNDAYGQSVVQRSAQDEQDAELIRTVMEYKGFAKGSRQIYTLDEGDIHDAVISAMNELFQTQAARNAVKASISAVLAGEEQTLSLPAVELQIRNLQERQLELFQLIVSAGADCTDYDEELRQVNMAKTKLMAKKAELEKEQRGAAAFEERLAELDAELEQSCGALTDFDELTVRQLVSNIKVLDKDSLLICFKDGTEITQAMQRRQTA